MLVLLALPVIVAVAAMHRYLQLYAPTNLLTRRVRAHEPRWRTAAGLIVLAGLLLVAMHVLAEASPTSTGVAQPGRTRPGLGRDQARGTCVRRTGPSSAFDRQSGVPRRLRAAVRRISRRRLWLTGQRAFFSRQAERGA